MVASAGSKRLPPVPVQGPAICHRPSDEMSWALNWSSKFREICLAIEGGPYRGANSHRPRPYAAVAIDVGVGNGAEASALCLAAFSDRPAPARRHDGHGYADVIARVCPNISEHFWEHFR